MSRPQPKRVVSIRLARQPVDRAGRIEIGPIEFELVEGEVIALLGPSGAGKTSLLEAVAGVHPTLVADVSINGESVPRPSRVVQLVFQDDRLPPWIKAEQALKMVVSSNGDPNRRVEDLMKIFDLEDKVGSWVATLSGGEKSRLSMARGFVDPPALLLLDEPFRNIDYLLRKRLRIWLGQVLESSGIATVMVSHSIEDAVALGHRIALLEQNPMTVWHFEELRKVGVAILPHEIRAEFASELFARLEGGSAGNYR